MGKPLTQLPKIELHDHLDGGLRPATIVELAKADGVRLPSDDAGALARVLSPGPSSLEVYLQAFAVTVSVMQTASSLRRVAFEAVEDWHNDGVVYGEIRFAPELHTRRGLAKEAVVEAVLKGLEDGRSATGIDTGLILCSMRHAPPSLSTAELVRRYRGFGVVGLTSQAPKRVTAPPITVRLLSSAPNICWQRPVTREKLPTSPTSATRWSPAGRSASVMVPSSSVSGVLITRSPIPGA